jgi:hypothetical protein
VERLVDCNSPTVWGREELRRRVSSYKVEYLDPLPGPVLEKLRAAVARSRLVEPWIKRLVVPEEG